MIALENRLVLHRFVCAEFGYTDMRAMLDRLRDATAGFDSGGGSEYGNALYLNPERARVTRERFAEYDADIVRHSLRLRMTEERGRGWKPHQYLALLFAERYLHRYFTDAEALLADLNKAKRREPHCRSMPDYTPDDLRTVAFQSATGSGKTLIMHAHILQYRHWLRRAGGRLNNVVLVTPNERMSAQHEREFRASGLHARVFSGAAGSDLMAPIEIVDLNKLAEKKGVKRVAVRDFGENNLVLVDEGHLGASGKVWREHRRELSRGGFAFEYSATFNQVAGNDERLRDAYGKCLLFDYPYRAFHADGYGKDYTIANLPKGMEDANSDMYLLGCLLTFYRQCRAWRDKGAEWTDYNPARPLWVFLGKTVTGRSRADRETRSDVVRILDFLGRVLANEDSVRPMLARLVAGESGLTDEAGRDWFAGGFVDLAGAAPDALHADICETLFHGPGRLRVVYLTAGDGELHLRTADNAPFGVVNVGDSTALHKMLTENANPDFDVEREAGFAESLFADVDRADSTVNVVVGARRFIAGWNSWRVSTMGLMHVGVGEGPEIIQMFGRGVRLKGWRMSLKRHRAAGAARPADSDGLALLETLHIFGLRANYMRTFRDLLQAEGISVERETVSLPVTWNFAKKPELKMVRPKPGARYERSDERIELPPPGDPDSPFAELDLYSRVHAVASGAAVGGGAEAVASRIAPRHVALFDRMRIHDALLKRKQRKGWDNMTVQPETVDRLLASNDWYTLHAPPEKLEPKSFADVRALENIAIELLADYADRFWRRRRRRWEHERLEVVTLDENDPNNIGAWKLSADAAQGRLVEDLRTLGERLRHGRDYGLKLTAIVAGIHAYKPLLHADRDCEISIQPVPLDANEKKVVEGLAALAENNDPCLQGREMFLIRNLTRGRGVSFFDDHAYYPDFILWLTNARTQHVVFLDPKGLVRYGPKERAKVALHKEIGEVEKRARKLDPTLRLRACILSVTPPGEIGDARRPQTDWERDGVYFMSDPDCLRKAIKDALQP